MTEQQIPKLAGSIVEHQSAFASLSTEDATWAIQNTKSAIALACEAIQNRNKPEMQSSAVLKHNIPSGMTTQQLGMWHEIYTTYFGLDEQALPQPNLPGEHDSFGWLVVVKKGLTIEQVVKALESKMKVYRYISGNLDEVVPTNERTADEDYAITVRDRIEADEELRSTSANQIKEKGFKTMTLLERLLLELLVLHFTGEHLDMKCYTICAGSRYSDGGVPSVYWSPDGDRLYIHWCRADDRCVGYAARAVQVAG